MTSSNAGSFSRYALGVAAMLALAADAGGLVFAQETPKAEAPAPDKHVNAWVVNCASGASGGALECQMSQNLTEAKTGQRVLTVTIR